MLPERPRLVTESLEKGKPIYYFGLGSNMSRKKIENRAIKGGKIEIESGAAEEIEKEWEMCRDVNTCR